MYSVGGKQRGGCLAGRSADGPERNVVKVKSPRTSRVQTRKSRIVIKGTARKSVSAVYVRNKRVSKTKLIEARGVKTWKAKVSLKPGVNKIDVLVDTGGAKPARVTKFVVIRTS